MHHNIYYLYISEVRFFNNIVYFIISPFILFVLLFVMVKDIRQIYKHSKSQLSTSSIKAPLSSSSEYQTSSAVKLTTISVPSARDKHQNNSVFNPQNTIQNYATITNNYDIQSCETTKRMIEFQTFQHLIIIHNILLPHTQVD